MSSDPFDLLTAINPVPAQSERLPGDSTMLAMIIAAPSRRSRRRHRVWLTGGAVVVATVGLAAFAFLRREAPSDPLRAVCYQTADHPPARAFEMAVDGDPVDQCSELWTDGRIASGEHAPRLTACVLDTGVIAAIPGDTEVCAELGLANWSGELSESDANVVAFQNALVDRFADACVTEADVDAEVRSLMAEFGLTDWDVAHRGNYTSDRRCSAVGAVAEERLVVIASRRDSSETDHT